MAGSRLQYSLGACTCGPSQDEEFARVGLVYDVWCTPLGEVCRLDRRSVIQ